MKKIVENCNKVDFHIHSFASKHRESDNCVDKSTIENIYTLISMLNNRNINMCSISDHDNFDYDLYKRLKCEENKGSIKKVFPAIEFSVVYENKILHIITIFDDTDENKLSKIKDYIFDSKKGVPKYDDNVLNAFTEDYFLQILRNIDLNVVMIAHQKESLSSKKTRIHDVKSVGNEFFDNVVFLDYFEAFEFKNKKNEIFNKYYISKNANKYKVESIRFITGSDCHNWEDYPNEDDNFVFSYLKCLPSFRGLVMAVTNIKRINYVNNFYSFSDKYLKEIQIEINGKNNTIPLSNGINVIIGDNSIGKSLLIHKLTQYNYLNNTELQNNYEQYLQDNNVVIKTCIDNNNISKFDGQGSIRKMFENKTFDSNSFLNEFFPVDPIITKYKEVYNNEISNYINVLKNKEALRLSNEKMDEFKIQLIETQANTLNLKKIPQNIFASLKTKTNKVGKIVENIQFINEKYQKILENEYLEIDDNELINEIIDKNKLIENKYKNEIKNIEYSISKRNIVNDIFDVKIKEYNKTQTDETEKLSTYENSKTTFINSVIDYYNKNQELLTFSPKISKEEVPLTSNNIGKYRFVKKTNEKEISNERLISIIKSCLGKSIKDINDISFNTIPDKFNNKGKETTYNEKLLNLENELKKVVNEIFTIKKAINNVLDEDVTKELLAGFNSRIYFDLISNQNEDNRIYIIDQPEDDVSQPAIKSNLLEDFYDMSRNKQIIMITHNPQFIVNLDVDNVIFIGKDENGEIFIQSGALEYFDDDYDILEIVANNIEGGIDSINERWKRYEKNIYDV